MADSAATEWEPVAEDDLVVVLRSFTGELEWFTWQCKECGARNDGGMSGMDRESAVQETFWSGWWHVAKKMGGKEFAYGSWQIEKAWLDENPGWTLDA
jgi:hypothetical protein